MGGWILVLYLLSPFVYLVFALLVSFFVVRRTRRKLGKSKVWRPIIAGISVFVVATLIPTWEILVAHGYMYYRCDIDGGLLLNKKIELPDRYFDKYGNVGLVRKSGTSANSTFLCYEEKCIRKVNSHELVLMLPYGSEVRRSETQYQDVDSGELIARYVSYVGIAWYGIAGSGVACPNYTRDKNITTNVFISAVANRSVKGEME